MFMKKEAKKQIVKEVKEFKEEKKKRKLEIATLPKDEQTKEKQNDKEAIKFKKQQRKKEIAQMSKEEKKIAKKRDKVFNKVKNRPRRAVGWGVFAAIIILIVSTIYPYLESFSQLSKISIVSETPEGDAARANGAIAARKVTDEGIVLLKNEDNSIPLKDNKLNVFSMASFDIKYGGAGSGGAGDSGALGLYEAFEKANIDYNKDIYNLYINQGAKVEKKSSTGLMQIVNLVFGKVVDEPDNSFLTEDIIKSAKAYSETALVVISTTAGETSDLNSRRLSPSPSSMALLEKVTDNFENVIIVINSGNTMQLGFIDEYSSIKSALWIGTPGPTGLESLAAILKGEVNPSGHLVDTYAYDSDSAPATVTLGDYPYSNIKGMSLINYNEGIYVGYRYYETRYLDDEEGYKKAVQYPFGYGLSYTDFDWEMVDYTFTDEMIKVQVKVINTGDMAGKDVVQVYFEPPYKDGGIEKSAIELAAYAKTSLLEPNKSETITLEFPVRDMSSYDMENGYYILEAGTYTIKIAEDVHNHIDEADYKVASNVIYKQDEVTGVEVTNRFDYAKGDLKYLSRNDWEGTYPKGIDINLTASQELVSLFSEKPAKVEGELPTMNADNGLSLADMKGLSYEDSKWDLFLDQFTLEEMSELFLDAAYSTPEIERLGVPQTILLDGPAGINSFFSNVTAASYPTEVVITATWNDELSALIGDAVGTEAVAYGVTGWYAPGMNIHRTSMGGRNNEYFSEDPLLSGKMGAAMVRGAQEHDIFVFIKHFIVNDQEINARNGVSVWVNEQALREIYLRPFEISTKEANATGAMSSFIYLGHKWCGGNPELLQDVLRHEWGFQGIVSTDAVLGSFMDLNYAVRYGNELMLDPFPAGNRKYLKKLYKEDPVGISTSLRDRIHTICYSIVNDTNLF